MLTELQNGAEILAQKPTRDGCFIVMAERHNAYQPYVTWIVNGEGYAENGHYFSDYTLALLDFQHRH